MKFSLNPAMTRREFLRYSGLALAGAALTPTLAACSPSPYASAVDSTWSLDGSGGDPANPTSWIHAATLAPNGHNAQPWKFLSQGRQITLRADFDRRLAVVDPADRELFISLGAALENLILAAQADGYQPSAEYFPADDPDGLQVTFQNSHPPANPLFAAIPLRQSTRSEYDSQPLPDTELSRLAAVPAEAGIGMHFYAPGDAMDILVEAVEAADQVQYADNAFLDELITWLRFNTAEATRSLDGLFTRCSGNPTVPRWIGKIFLSLSGPKEMAAQDEKKLRSSPGLVLFTSEQDDRSAWVKCGQTYERFALTATTLGIKTAFMNQPVEVGDIRATLGQSLGLGAAYPQLLARFGYADEMPRSLRRTVAQVMA